VRAVYRVMLIAAWLASPVLGGGAQAQTKLTASYTISLLGITIGTAEWELEVNEQYLAQASGRISGVASKLISGQGSASVRGALVNNHAQPAAFEADIKTDAETDNVRMMFDAAGVSELAVEPALPPTTPGSQRVPVSAADRKGVLDPLSGLLVIANADPALGPPTCQRRIPIFDGRRRYDVVLSFKRMDDLKAETGYAGPVIVCSIHVVPISGHRVGGSFVQRLVKSDDLEVALAPLAGTRILAPFQAAVPTAVGTVWIAADRFVVTNPTPAISGRP
jgi:hypothetical protein